MKDINIGSRIANKRREKGITQEELAEFLCVSKPAVSKWESGQSYPDITLLPVLATYFNISVDELLGYEPQMTKEKIKELYVKLSKDFAEKPFNEIYEKCNEYRKKYFSCYKLQFHIGLLFVNNVNLAEDKEKILNEAISIFHKVASESDDVSLAKQAICLQGYCYLIINKPVLAIDLLEEIEEIPVSSEVLLSRAYYVKGNHKKAVSIIQGFIFKNILCTMDALNTLMGFYMDNKIKTKETYEKIVALGDIFGINEINPSLYFSLYLSSAYIYAMQGENNSALDMLEKYVEILYKPGVFPLKMLKGNDFFDSLEDYFNSLDLGGELPRSEKLIKKSIKESVINNPVFNNLSSEDRYKRIIKKLEEF